MAEEGELDPRVVALAVENFGVDRARSVAQAEAMAKCEAFRVALD